MHTDVQQCPARKPDLGDTWKEAASLPPCLLSIRSWYPCGLVVGECYFLGLSFQCAKVDSRKQRVDCCWICMQSHPHQSRTGYAAPILCGIWQALEPQTHLPNWNSFQEAMRSMSVWRSCSAPELFPLCRVKYFLNIRKLNYWSLLSLPLFEDTSCHFQ